MMQNARNDLASMRAWATSGGEKTWDSYNTDDDSKNGLRSVPEEHWAFLKSLCPYFETNTHIFVHASVDAEINIADQFDDALFWGNFDSIGPHISGKHVVCGHTSQKNGIPESRPHATCIDTWACGSGWLTCLDVQTGKYFQANQTGETRSDWLEQT